jgi:hypothetical protein
MRTRIRQGDRAQMVLIEYVQPQAPLLPHLVCMPHTRSCTRVLPVPCTSAPTRRMGGLSDLHGPPARLSHTRSSQMEA